MTDTERINWLAKRMSWSLASYNGPDYLPNATESNWALESGHSIVHVVGNTPPRNFREGIDAAIEQELQSMKKCKQCGCEEIRSDGTLTCECPAIIFNVPTETIHGVVVYEQDGNKICAHRLNFIDLQSSPAGFGTTPIEALVNLISEESKDLS